MAKRNKKQTRRIRNLVLLCALCAVILTVSTYAWFIGMKTVNVSSFDINIATTEGLFLSMDGNEWTYTLDTSKAKVYSGNTNVWAPDGLIPMSTVGDMDPVSSRMKLYEKASLTTSDGGYRLLTSRVQNFATDPDDGSWYQGKGYVAFDLFIKNLSGEEYYVENEPLNEEAIYLTTNSSVTVANGGIAGTGIENSVRVAFTQIGRVEADDEIATSNITAITCDNVAAGDGQAQVTGICRNAQIWEPNDTKHVTNAINWYTTSCTTRVEGGADITKAESFDKSTECGTVVDGTANKTYAISRELGINDNVDVYDGAQYNSYTANDMTYAAYLKETDKSKAKLVDFPYFTDTMKNLESTERPTFMTLAPNSITKLRVYVYLEGQDVDNYDFASLGAKISVNFGFTKERLTEKDIDYVGPATGTATKGDEIATGEE